MSGKYTWIKLYTEILQDPKMGRLSDEHWRLAVELMLLAGNEGRDGILPSLDDMAWILRTDEESLQARLEALSQAIGLGYDDTIERWILTHFSQRQAAMSPAERKRKQRGSNPAEDDELEEEEIEPDQETISGEMNNVINPDKDQKKKTFMSRKRDINVTETNKQRDMSVTEEEEEEEVEVEVEVEKIRSRSRPARALRGGLSADARKKPRERSLAPARGAAAAAAVNLNLKPKETKVRATDVPPELLEYYGANIGKINQYARDWLVRQTEKYSAPTVRLALEEGLRFGVQNHRYLEAILTRWESEGVPGQGGVVGRKTTRNSIQDELAAFLASGA